LKHEFETLSGSIKFYATPYDEGKTDIKVFDNGAWEGVELEGLSVENLKTIKDLVESRIEYIEGGEII